MSMADIQRDEKLQEMSPLDLPSTKGDGGQGADLTSIDLDSDSDDIQVEFLDSEGEGAAPVVEKEILEEDDPSIQDIEKELSVEQMDKLGLTKGVRERIGKLTWQKNEERRQRESMERMQQEAVRFAETQSGENKKLRELLQRGEQVMVSEVRSRTKSDLAAAEQAYTIAVEDGDSHKVLAAQKALNRAQMEQYEADRYSPTLSNQGEQETQGKQGNQGRQQEGQYRQQEQYYPPSSQPQQHHPVQDASRDPKLIDWKTKNTWFQQDEAMTNEAMNIHRELTEIRGVNPMTDEYYNHLDKRLDQLFPERNGKQQEQGAKSQGGQGSGEPAATPAPSVVASSAGRQSAGANKGRSRIVQLTLTQKNLAERLGLTPEQYARQLLKEQNNG